MEGPLEGAELGGRAFPAPAPPAAAAALAASAFLAERA